MHATTGKSPAELLYGFNPRHAVDLINPSSPSAAEEWAMARDIQRKDAADAIALAQAVMKIHADRKREEFLLKPGDKAYLRLHTGYHLPGVPKAKIGQQRVGPFEVEEVVGGGNAYKLKLPKSWKVWPVISAAFLDKALSGPDPYERIETPQPVVEEGELLADGDRWEVAAIVGKRIYRKKVQYLVRWLHFGPEDDTWMNISELNGCAELVEEYEKSVGNKEWKPPAEWVTSAAESTS